MQQVRIARVSDKPAARWPAGQAPEPRGGKLRPRMRPCTGTCLAALRTSGTWCCRQAAYMKAVEAAIALFSSTWSLQRVGEEAATANLVSPARSSRAACHHGRHTGT